MDDDILSRVRFRPMTKQDMIEACNWPWVVEHWNDTPASFAAFCVRDTSQFSVAAVIGDELVGTFLVGQIDGDIHYGSQFIVKEAYKGLGVGRAIWNRLMEKTKHLNVVIDAMSDMVDFYKRKGFQKSAWQVCGYSGCLDRENLQSYVKGQVEVIDINKSNMADLCQYDRVVHVFEREEFLKESLSVCEGTFGFAALDASGKIIGYTIVHQAPIGHRIEMLYADSDDVTFSLLVAIVEKLGVENSVSFNCFKDHQIIEKINKHKENVHYLYTMIRMQTKNEIIRDFGFSKVVLNSSCSMI